MIIFFCVVNGGRLVFLVVIFNSVVIKIALIDITKSTSEFDILQHVVLLLLGMHPKHQQI